MRTVVIAIFLGFPVFACSSGSTPGGGNTDSGGGGGGGSPSSCSCSVSFNGVSKTIDCGSQSCVNGVNWTCSATAESAMGSACTAPITDSGSPGTPGTDSGPSGCQLFKCANTAGCGRVAPCMSTATGTSYCYEQEGSPAQCSAGTTPTTKNTSNGPTTLCVPAGCPQPVMFIP